MKKIILFCFMGTDGSGKSTLAKYLYEELKSKKINVSYTWWLEPENSCMRKLLRKLVKSYNVNTNRIKDLNKSANDIVLKNRIFREIYAILVLLDYLRFGIIKAGYFDLPKKQRIFIYDRYYFDVICSLAREFTFSETYMKRLFRLFGFFLPNPDLVMYIDVPPEIALARKTEELGTIENATSIWEDYIHTQNLVTAFTAWKTVTIDNSRDIIKPKLEVIKNVLEIIG